MQHTLIQLIIAFHKFADAKGKHAKSYVNYSYRLFLHQCNKYGVIPPKNYVEFIKLMQKPVEEWGIEGIEKDYPKNLPLIDRFLRPMPESDELIFLIDEDVNKLLPNQMTNHFYQLVMREFMQRCQQEQLDQAYQEVRAYLSEPKHAVISAPELIKFRALLNRYGLDGFEEKFYEVVPHIENYHKCPYCHWTLRYDEALRKYICNYSRPCHDRANLQHSVSFKEETNPDLHYFRLNPGIQRFVLIPGICELRIKKALERKGFHVEIYPEIDRYDLKASRGAIELNSM